MNVAEQGSPLPSLLGDDYLGLNPAIVLHITSILILSTFLVEVRPVWLVRYTPLKYWQSLC